MLLSPQHLPRIQGSPEGSREQTPVCVNLKESSLGVCLASFCLAVNAFFGPFFAKEILMPSYQAVGGFS